MSNFPGLRLPLRLPLALLLFFAAPLSAHAAGGSAAPLPPAPIERDNYDSLQRGAANFINYCSGCHSAQYIRYGRIAEDLGIPESTVRQKLLYNEAKLSDGIISAMRPDEAAEWFHQAPPPDLSLSAKLRGTDWLVAYLLGFYRDDTRPSGWQNSVFENVAMPHVLANLQGEYALTPDGEKKLIRRGALSDSEYRQFVLDTVNFMDYIAEPSRKQRHLAGYIILSFLLLLLVVTFYLYKEYWRDIH